MGAGTPAPPAVVTAAGILGFLLPRFYLRWGATDAEVDGGLPGDDFLEDLMGLDIHSADRIHPEWQDIMAGDPFHLAPAASADLEVGLVDGGTSLVLRVPPGAPPGPFDFTWAFVLRPQSDGTTRLVVRERYAYSQ